MSTEPFVWLLLKGLEKVKEELQAYGSDEAIWQVKPGISNSAGHLVQHLIGNLKTYVGREMGGIAYTRERDREFNERQFERTQLMALVDETAGIVMRSLQNKDAAFLDSPFPESIVNIKDGQDVRFMLSYLSGHLQYHLGQINYHRRLC